MALFVFSLVFNSTTIYARGERGGGERGGERGGAERFNSHHDFDRNHHGNININGGGDGDSPTVIAPNPDWDEDPDIESTYQQNQQNSGN